MMKVMKNMKHLTNQNDESHESHEIQERHERHECHEFHDKRCKCGSNKSLIFLLNSQEMQNKILLFLFQISPFLGNYRFKVYEGK